MRSSGIELIRRLVLDTSSYSRMRHGHELALDLIAGAEAVLVPATVLGELEGGFELGRRSRENRVALDAFLAEPTVAILPTTIEVARQYGRIYARQRRAGRPVPANDMWIAAATVDCGGHLLTFDSDFRQIEALDCTVLEA